MAGHLESWRRWAPILGKFLSVQLAVQAMGFGGGILVLRTLGEGQFALYTLANTLMGTLNLLADTGIGIALSALGGRVWQDPHRFGRLIATTRRLRRTFAASIAVFALPALAWLLRSHGASWGTVVALTVLVAGSVACHLDIGVFLVVPRLRGEVDRLQRVDLLGGGVRLALVAAAALVFLNAAVALAAATLAAVAQLTLLRRYAHQGIDADAPPDPAYRREILAVVRTQAANTVFYCFQGQITVWLIGLFGNTTAIAEVGALGRLAVIFALIGSVQGSIVAPRFARCQDPATLRRRYGQIFVMAMALAGGLVVLAGLLPGPLLSVLGPRYGHLRAELPLMVAGTTLAFVAATLWSLNASRAWVEFSWLYIPVTLAVQAVCLPFVDLTTVRGVLIFGLAPEGPLIVMNLVLGLRGLRRFAAATPVPLPS